MKKIVLISTIIGMIASNSVFGQGSFTFTGSPRFVWDDTNPTPKVDSSNSVAFLWAANGSVSGVSSVMSAVPTNNATPFNYAQAWSAILGDANFKIATNSADSSIATTTTGNNGSFGYNGNLFFNVVGTTANVTYSLFVIGWNNNGGLLLNPFAAALAGQAVGWSGVFTYTSTDAPPLGNPGVMGFNQFGVGVGIVPEPTTFALAGLGAASLLIFRKRKQ